MRHSDPHIQELIEQLQGALRVFAPFGTAPSIVWYVQQTLSGGWNIRFVIINTRDNSYSVAFEVRAAVYDIQRLGSQFWDSFKWNVIRQCVWKIISDSQPAAESEVEYAVDHDEEALEWLTR